MNPPFSWTDVEVQAALGLPANPVASGLRFSGVSTDTRTLSEADLFVALGGRRSDGHDHLDEALASGARAAVVSTPEKAPAGLPIYVVRDTLEALGELAHHRRVTLGPRVIGVTGSSGKTAVKDLLAGALRSSFRLHATRGNRNNRVGVPLTLLEAPDDAEVIVLEMGTSEPGEIQRLTTIARPDAALVTTVSESHLTGLRSFAGVLEEKLDLIRGIRAGEALLVGDDPDTLPDRARKVRSEVRVAGFSERADRHLRGTLLDPDLEGRYRIRFGGHEMTAGLPGRHGAGNLVLALAMSELLGVDLEAAAAGASAVRAGSLRGEVRQVGGLTVLLDCYNANPQSVAAAMELLGDLPGSGGRVAVLGSMLELGNRSDALHREIIERVSSRSVDLIVGVGLFAAPLVELAKGRADRPELVPASDLDEAYDALRTRLSGVETVLLKGSRGVALEGLFDRLVEDFGGGPAVPSREDN